MSKPIMIQGTMSNAGKSLICAGLCRILKNKGYRVAPFKSQNMALNSYITLEGLEIGRAQAVQAMAAGKEPSVYMNPILLKPTNDVGSQVIVNGVPVGDMSARDYFKYKKSLIPDIKAAYDKLSEDNDVIVIEGAGSPAEINLKNDDIVNMGMAELVDAPVFLVGDIDRGGVFAQLYGTLELLEPQERARIKGFIINKFRGDASLLDSGIEMLERKTGIPVVGVVPYMNVDIEDEDSLSERFNKKHYNAEADKIYSTVNIAVVRFPRISNFTDLYMLENNPQIKLSYVNRACSELEQADIIVLPGTKNTQEDLLWLRQMGLEALIKKAAAAGKRIIGICGGYQMLGEQIDDPENAEGGKSLKGIGLLPVKTVFSREKVKTRVCGRLVQSIFNGDIPEGTYIEGYEMHMGESFLSDSVKPVLMLENQVIADSRQPARLDGCAVNNVFGTYVHGIFDSEDFLTALLVNNTENKSNAEGKRVSPARSLKDYRQEQFEHLAAELEKSIDMQLVERLISEDVQEELLNNKNTHVFEKLAPLDIERRSFEIITRELKEAGICLSEKEAPIIKRCIHTAADFDYAKNLYFSTGVIDKAISTINNGVTIITDTKMAASGINKAALRKTGSCVLNFISDEDVAEIAKSRGVTRSAVCMEKASQIEGPVIIAIGNAPTALIRCVELYNEGLLKPELVIGVPVGFVNVEYSKQLAKDCGFDCIIAEGRKGGSNIAAAIVNALMYMVAR